MDSMLMAIIGTVVVVLLVGFFMIKNRGKNSTQANQSTSPSALPSQKTSNRPKTLAEQQRELEARPTAPEIDTLVIAQQYYDQKDYTSAINSLKTAIGQQPTRADLQLLLLKSYAEQKNYADFNHAYTTLNALNDPNASAQATKLKQLLDEEQAFTNNPIASVPSSIPVVAAAAAAPVLAATAAATVPDSLDFDDFSFDVTPDTPASVPVTASTDSGLVDDGFSFDDLSFDNLETQITNTNVPNTQAVDSNVSNVPTLANPTQDMIDSPEEDHFDLSFDDLELDTPTAPQPSVTTHQAIPNPTASSDLDFSDLDIPELDLAAPHDPNAANSTSMSDTAAPTLSDASFDFDIPPTDLINSKLDTTLDTPSTLATTSSASPANIEPSINTNTLSQSDAIATNTNVADLEEFDFDFTEVPDTQSNALVDTDNFSIDTPLSATASTPTLQDIQQDTQLDTINFDNFDIISDEPSVVAASMSEKLNTAASPSIQATSTSNQNLLDEDFNFDLEASEPEGHNIQKIEGSVSELTDPHFDLDISEDINPTISTANPSSSALELTPVTALSATVSDTVSDSTSDTVVPQPYNAPAFAESIDLPENDTLSQLDALYHQPTTPDISEPNLATSESPVLSDTLSLDSLTGLDTPNTQAMPVATDLNNAFAFLKDMDSTQINLDLAEQYIELGEYDSAKRLLNEISNANPTQQTMVTNLLDKIG